MATESIAQPNRQRSSSFSEGVVTNNPALLGERGHTEPCAAAAAVSVANMPFNQEETVISDALRGKRISYDVFNEVLNNTPTKESLRNITGEHQLKNGDSVEINKEGGVDNQNYVLRHIGDGKIALCKVSNKNGKLKYKPVRDNNGALITAERYSFDILEKATVTFCRQNNIGLNQLVDSNAPSRGVASAYGTPGSSGKHTLLAIIELQNVGTSWTERHIVKTTKAKAIKGFVEVYKKADFSEEIDRLGGIGKAYTNYQWNGFGGDLLTPLGPLYKSQAQAGLVLANKAASIAAKMFASIALGEGEMGLVRGTAFLLGKGIKALTFGFTAVFTVVLPAIATSVVGLGCLLWTSARGLWNHKSQIGMGIAIGLGIILGIAVTVAYEVTIGLSCALLSVLIGALGIASGIVVEPLLRGLGFLLKTAGGRYLIEEERSGRVLDNEGHIQRNHELSNQIRGLQSMAPITYRRKIVVIRENTTKEAIKDFFSVTRFIMNTALAILCNPQVLLFNRAIGGILRLAGYSRLFDAANFKFSFLKGNNRPSCLRPGLAFDITSLAREIQKQASDKKTQAKLEEARTTIQYLIQQGYIDHDMTIEEVLEDVQPGLADSLVLVREWRGTAVAAASPCPRSNFELSADEGDSFQSTGFGRGVEAELAVAAKPSLKETADNLEAEGAVSAATSEAVQQSERLAQG